MTKLRELTNRLLQSIDEMKIVLKEELLNLESPDERRADLHIVRKEIEEAEEEHTNNILEMNNGISHSKRK